MNFMIRVKQGHPTGVRRRSGLTFTREGLVLSSEQVTKEMAEDPWLEGEVIEPAQDFQCEMEEAKAAELLKRDQEDERSRLEEQRDAAARTPVEDVSGQLKPDPSESGGAVGQPSAAEGSAQSGASAAQGTAVGDGNPSDGHDGRKRKKS